MWLGDRVICHALEALCRQQGYQFGVRWGVAGGITILDLMAFSLVREGESVLLEVEGAERILILINKGGTHWVLPVVEVDEQMVQVVDSMGESNPATGGEVIEWHTEQWEGSKGEWRLAAGPEKRQSNTCDC
jgi:hypothetical protein